MRLFQLLYVSRAFGGVSDEMLRDIHRAASAHNAHLGVTGLLLSSRGHFFQILEGSPVAVANLYSVIEEDARHTDSRVVYFGPAEKRCFPHWTMGVLDLDEPAHDDASVAELWRLLNEHDAPQSVRRANLIEICETFRGLLQRAA